MICVAAQSIARLAGVSMRLPRYLHAHNCRTHAANRVSHPAANHKLDTLGNDGMNPHYTLPLLGGMYYAHFW